MYDHLIHNPVQPDLTKAPKRMKKGAVTHFVAENIWISRQSSGSYIVERYHDGAVIANRGIGFRIVDIDHALRVAIKFSKILTA
jgi:hypothetical protein